MLSKRSQVGSDSTLLTPMLRINSLIALGRKPLLLNPEIVGSRGSSHPSSSPLSINLRRLRFDTVVFCRERRENSIILGILRLSDFRMASYISSRSSYSLLRMPCVPPSRLSSTGPSKSYVGQTRYFLSLSGWRSSTIRKSTGSLIVVLRLCISPANLSVALFFSSLPSSIILHSERFCSGV